MQTISKSIFMTTEADLLQLAARGRATTDDREREKEIKGERDSRRGETSRRQTGRGRGGSACEQWEAVRVAAVIDLHVGSLESFCRLSSLFAALTK